MNILLTGGAGYIGSHTAIVLSEDGHNVILLDNFCNSEKYVVSRLNEILKKNIICIEEDIRNIEGIKKILKEHKIDTVIHFAGLKAVNESVTNPILYYENNVKGTINLIQAMQSVGVKSLVFSSSATVYGEPHYLPYDEQHPTNPINPYGRTKLQAEEILQDLVRADPDWGVVCLRYFNPVGAHESGLIGEDPKGIPNNLMPYINKVGNGELPYVNIFGNDYETSDGTGERDYIHVIDLAEGHNAAMKYLENNKGWTAINLGSGMPCSVMNLIKTFNSINGLQINTRLCPRRSGDLAVYYASPEKAKNILNWKSKRSIEDICKSAWNFQRSKK